MSNSEETINKDQLFRLYLQMGIWCVLSIAITCLLCWLAMPSVNIALIVPVISAVIVAGIGGTTSAKRVPGKNLPKGFGPLSIGILWALVWAGLGYLFLGHLEGDLQARAFFVLLYGVTVLISLGVGGVLFGIVFYYSFKRKKQLSL